MFNSFVKRYEVNRAVVFSVLSKVWSLLAGPVIILVIAQYFSSELQGYYYTFTSILLFQMFFELGLGIVVVQAASHEWAFLQLDSNKSISGESKALSRLASLLRFSLKWYSVSAVVLAIVLAFGGYAFFSGRPEQGIAWEWPWYLLAITSGLALPFIPVLSVLEGCDQVSKVYGFRLVQGVLNSVATILGIVLGAGLFTPAISVLTRALSSLVFILYKYRIFFFQLLVLPVVHKVSWLQEIWPFQWRVAVSTFSGYVMHLLFTPIMFHYYGSKIAGQMGMSLSLAGVVSSLGYTWVQTRVPKFGAMIARKEYGELDRLFYRLAGIAVFVTSLGVAGIWSLVLGLNHFGYELADRVLPLWPFTALLLAEIFKVTSISIVFYLRAHKMEPLMPATVVSSLLTVCSVWYFGSGYGSLGATSSYLVVIACVSFPLNLYIFNRFRTSYQGRQD